MLNFLVLSPSDTRSQIFLCFCYGLFRVLYCKIWVKIVAIGYISCAGQNLSSGLLQNFPQNSHFTSYANLQCIKTMMGKASMGKGGLYSILALKQRDNLDHLV